MIRENGYGIYEEKTTYELETKLIKLEKMANWERENKSEREIIEEMCNIVEGLEE